MCLFKHQEAKALPDADWQESIKMLFYFNFAEKQQPRFPTAALPASGSKGNSHWLIFLNKTDP